MIIWLLLIFILLLGTIMGLISKSGKKEVSSFGNQKICDIPNVVRFSVKGTIYRDKNDIFAAQLCEVGDIIILRQEPNNPVDKNAIKVLTQTGRFIGYVDKDNAICLNRHFKHISKCAIVTKSKHDIPYIDVEVLLSNEECRQQEIITDKADMTTRQLLIEDIDSFSNAGYVERRATIVNNKELPLESIQALQQCDVLTPLSLSKDETNPKRKYAIKVYNDVSGILLGWVEFYSAFRIYDHLDKIKNVRLDKKGSHFIVFMLPKGLDEIYPSKEDVSAYQIYNATLYPEISEAYKMRTANPEKALSILLPLIDKEKDIRSMSISCTCYRALKRPKEELKMIERILEKITKLQQEEKILYGRISNPDDCEKWQRRKQLVEKMIK